MFCRNGIRNLDFIKKQKLTKKKIIFILPSLRAGGAERVISFVAQQLNPQVFDVKLIVIGFKKEAVYDVKSLNVQYLNKARLLTSITTLFRIILTERPSIVVSSIGHVNITMGLFSMIFRRIKFIGREASVVSKMNEYAKVNSNLIYMIMKLFYSRLSMIICQSEDMKQDFILRLGIQPSKLIVIHNPITNSDLFTVNKITNKKYHFVTVGRLSKEKGHLRIIKGLSKIRNYDFHYTVVGSGPLEVLIKQEIKKLQLSEKVSFIPYTSRVLDEIIKNDFFIQGSYVEGFPNALLESCTVGTPVIAFKAPGGTKDIVLNGINGFLVDDELEFVTVLNDLNKLKTIDEETVRSSVLKKFESRKIVQQYEDLFNSL
jgi:glycosyltransferase involved in cell wall biosynthesis